MSYITLNKIFLHFFSKISFAVIAHNTEQQYGIVLRYPQTIVYYPWGQFTPVWEPLVYTNYNMFVQ